MAAPTKLTALRIPLGDVRHATNNFHDDNIIGGGGFGAIYKGQLLWSGESIKIAARRLDRDGGFGDVEFWTEVAALSDLRHPNLVSMIGYCDDDGEKIIITKYEVKGSLAQYLNSPNLTWGQRIRICIGVALALSYLQSEEGRDYCIIHRNVNRYTILLDENWEPKLSGFEISIKQSVSQMEWVIPSDPIGEMGYIDPAIEKTRGVTYKSDVYSFGVVLFELLCGRMALMEEEEARVSVPRDHCTNGKLLDIIHPDMWNQMSEESLNIYSNIAFYCTSEDRADRPDSSDIFAGLDQALGLQLRREYYENNLELLIIPLNDIKLATEDFNDKHIIGFTRYFTLFRVELPHLHIQNSSTPNGRKTIEAPQRQNTIVIQRIRSNVLHGKENVFYSEVELLTCVKHQNVVNLLGLCVEGHEKILLIQNLSNGLLEDCFRNVKKNPLFTWEKRVKISIDVAHVLIYLHSKMDDQNKVIACHMGSMNIALDENWGAKFIQFGAWHGLETPECNVYHFGIVLFDILFGRKTNDDDDRFEEGDNALWLACEAQRCIHTGRLEEMMDPIINEETCEQNFNQIRGPDKASLMTFIQIAYRCLLHEDQRPTMEDVIKELEKALYYQMERGQHPDMGLTLDESEKAFHLELEGKQWNVQSIDEIESEKAWEHKIMNEFSENPKLLKISLADIKLATEDFDAKYMCLGGSYSTSYKVEFHQFDKETTSSGKGRSKDQQSQRHDIVELRHFYKGQSERFYKELKMLATVKHRNILKLFGFCVEDDEKFLLVEYLPHRSLYGYCINDTNMRALTWEKRLKICINVAHAINYLHFGLDDRKVIIVGDVNNLRIALDENLEAKIVDFGMSEFLALNQEDDVIHVDIYEATQSCRDPKFNKIDGSKTELDVYKFGVFMLEILLGKLSVYDLVSEIRQYLNSGKLEEVMDTRIKNETGENTFILSRGPSKDSLDIFTKIARRCVAETQDQCLTMTVVVKELENALFLQRNNKDNPVMSLEDIKVATGDFDPKNYIGGGAFGKVYVGKLKNEIGLRTIVAKRLYGQGKQQFLNEIQILLEYRHENVIGLVGYCDEEDEKIIVYEYASRNSLDRYLNDTSLTWFKRLNICIQVASALDFLHGGAEKQAKVVHRDIKTANILLNHDWKAKLADFGLSLISAITKETDYVIDRACGTPGYVDPLYIKTKFLTVESDIYSFGVVLFEILCGRSTHAIFKQESHDLVNFVKKKFKEGKHEEVVFEKIKGEIEPNSMTTFQDIAYRCLHHEREDRPTTKEVLTQLQRALEFQISREG